MPDSSPIAVLTDSVLADPVLADPASTHSVSAALRDAIAVVRDAVSADHDDATLACETIRELIELRNVTEHQLAAHTATLCRLGVDKRQGRKMTELLGELGVAPADAHRWVRIGRALGSLGTVDGFSADGAFSSAHVDAIVRGLAHIEQRSATPIDSDERRQFASSLAAQAFSTTTPTDIFEYARTVGNIRSDDTGGLPAAEDRCINSVTTTKVDGRLRVKADLDAVVGEKLMTAIDKFSAPQPQPDGSHDPRGPERRCADALEIILDLAANGATADASSNINGDNVISQPFAGLASPTQLGLTIPAATPELSTLPFMGAVTEATARRLACDADVTVMITDGEEVPLAVGRTKRLFTRTQRRALKKRDHCCIKCGAPASWTRAHHITHWADGGDTDLDNGCLLCSSCHDDVHHRGWDVVMGHDRHPWLIPPTTVDPQRRPIMSYHRRTMNLDNLPAAA